MPRLVAGRLGRAKRLEDQLLHADLGRLVVHAEGDAADFVDLQRLPAQVLPPRPRKKHQTDPSRPTRYGRSGRMYQKSSSTVPIYRPSSPIFYNGS